MFKNPLKYQKGGSAPTQEQQQVLAAFIEWLPKRVKEFQGMRPEEIAQALDGMTRTPEGQKQVQQLMQQFQQEIQSSQSFRQGGKIHDFICKHAKGGNLKGCGCKQEGGEINQYGPGGWLRNLFRRDSQGLRQVNVTGFDPDGSSSDPFYGSEMTETLPNAHQRRIRSNWWGMGQEPVRDTSIVTPTGKVSNSDENWRSENDAFDRAKYIELPGTTIDDYVKQKYRLRNPDEMERGGKVTKASDGSDGIPQAKNAKVARRAASKNTVSVGNSGRAKNRKIGAATDKFGGQHLYEDSVIDGSWSDVYVDVPHPGDTIVTQSFPVAGGNDTTTRTYPMGSEEYESVMSRMRPAFRMFFPQYKCGGNIKKKESSKVIKGQNGFLNLWQSAYDSKFGKGLRNFMFGTDSDLSNEEYVKKHGYSKPIMGMPPAVKISYIPEGVYGSTRMAEQAAKAAKEAAKFKHVSPLDGGRLGHTIKDVSGVHLKNNGGNIEKAQKGKDGLGESSIVFPSNTSRISYSFQPVISADPIIDSLAINAPNHEYETVRWNTGPDSYRYFTMPVNRNGYFRYHDDDYIGWPDTYGLDVKEARKPGFWKSFVWGRNVYPVDPETYRKVDSLITANRSPEVQKHIEEGKTKSKKKNE